MRTDAAICLATSAGSAVNGPGRLFDRAVVVTPAHNEAGHLPSSVKAVLTAAARLPLPVTVIVVLDGCDDGSAALAGQFGFDVDSVAINACNVGRPGRWGFPTRARSPNRERSTIRGSGRGVVGQVHAVVLRCCWPMTRVLSRATSARGFTRRAHAQSDS